MKSKLLTFLVLATATVISASATPVSITSFGVAVSENFDTLVLSGTSSSLPAGWEFSEVGTITPGLYTAGTGSSATGDTYSFGAAGSTERALGGLQSGSLIPTFGVQFQNNTGGTIISLTIGYTGEQWRLGTLGRPDQLDFQVSFDATSLTTGTWINVNPLDFVAPITGPTTGALNGNIAPNRTVLSSTSPVLGLVNGSTFWLRWVDFNATSSDDGLAIDDFSLKAEGFIPPVPDTGTTVALLILPLLGLWTLRRLTLRTA